jgi:hypothetical protein
MTVKLSSLLATTKPVTVTFGEEQIHLVVRTTELTTDVMVQFAALARPTTDTDEAIANVKSTADLFCRVVVSWDVEGDDGKVFPITAAEISKSIPLEVLSACVQGAMLSMGESSAVKNGKISDGISPREALSATSPNGTH